MKLTTALLAGGLALMSVPSTAQIGPAGGNQMSVAIHHASSEPYMTIDVSVVWSWDSIASQHKSATCHMSAWLTFYGRNHKPIESRARRLVDYTVIHSESEGGDRYNYVRRLSWAGAPKGTVEAQVEINATGKLERDPDDLEPVYCADSYAFRFTR